MKLTSKGKYAIQAVLDLANNSNGRAVRLSDISERQKISLHYLEQLFRKLRQKNVVRSVRGPGGGYVLAKTPAEITVMDVFASVGEKINYLDSLKTTQEPTKEQQALAGLLTSGNAALTEWLMKTLAELSA